MKGAKNRHKENLMTEHVNISYWLKDSARKYPYKRAIVYPESRNKKGRVLYSQLTFKQLDQESNYLAYGLQAAGISRGTRTILMVLPGLDFFTITFALFKLGAVPVVVDPGMGINRMLSCFMQSSPEAFIGIEKAHLLRILKPNTFKYVRTWITVGRRWLWRGHSLKQVRQVTKKPFPVVKTLPDETAAILFTTGSTGPAKGVVYTHGNFDAQLKQIKSHFNIGSDEIDLPTFPLFALFDPALGMTAIIPDMDPTKPARANPERIIEAIEDQGVTNMFASPALLNRVGQFGKIHMTYLPSLRRVVSAGAPVTPANIETFSSMLKRDTQIHTPYGATEAVPIVSITSTEILEETRKLSEQGYGMCVGRPICHTRVELIEVKDTPILNWSDSLIVRNGEVGEIVVKDDLVTRHYYDNPEADRLSKIEDSEGSFWHRMGDLAWRDNGGRLWFCGRKSQRVITSQGTMYTIPCEAIFNNHEKVFRSALVGIGPLNAQEPAICIEPVAGMKNTKELLKELYDLSTSHPLTQDIKHILIHREFPVDIRHNSKIFREKLSIWAGKKLGM